MSSEKLTFQPAPCSFFDEVISYCVYRPVFGGADEILDKPCGLARPLMPLLATNWTEETNTVAVSVLHIHLAVAPVLINRAGVNRDTFSAQFLM